MERINSQEVKEDKNEEKSDQDCLTTLVQQTSPRTGPGEQGVKLTKKPIELQWCCGVNPKIDVIDLTTKERVLFSTL